MGNLLSGEVDEVLLTKSEIEYLKELLALELLHMTKLQVKTDLFERKACVSILNRLDGNKINGHF